jgi:hypothetical protein
MYLKSDGGSTEKDGEHNQYELSLICISGIHYLLTGDKSDACNLAVPFIDGVYEN